MSRAVRPAEMKAGFYRGHAIRRAGERYGLAWDATHVAAVEGMIQAARRDARSCPDAVPFGRNADKPTREWWAIRWDGVWLPVVYDARVKALVSVLPMRRLDYVRPRLEGWTEADPESPATTPRRTPRSAVDDGLPPVGTITGFVSPPGTPECDDAFLRPPAADPGAESAAEFARPRSERERLREELRAAHRACGELRKDHPDRPPIVAEIVRLNARLAEIKAAAGGKSSAGGGAASCPALPELPPLPDLPADPTLGEADAVKAAMKGRIAAANRAIHGGGLGPGARSALTAEVGRLTARREELERAC
jgi:hypothetical protein